MTVAVVFEYQENPFSSMTFLLQNYGLCSHTLVRGVQCSLSAIASSPDFIEGRGGYTQASSMSSC